MKQVDGQKSERDDTHISIDEASDVL